MFWGGLSSCKNPQYGTRTHIINLFCSNSSCGLFHFFQIRYCITPQQRCGLTRTSPRATTASPPPTPGSRLTPIPPWWRLPLLAPTLWGQKGLTDRRRLTSCHSNSSSSSSRFSSRVNYNSCSRSSRSSTTSNSSSCSISNNRWSLTFECDSLTPVRYKMTWSWHLVCKHVYCGSKSLQLCINCEHLRFQTGTFVNPTRLFLCCNTRSFMSSEKYVTPRSLKLFKTNMIYFKNSHLPKKKTRRGKVHFWPWK